MTLVELARKLRPYIEKAAESLNDDDAVEAVQLFKEWAPGVSYKRDDRVRWKGVLYRVPQAHLSSELYPPDSTGVGALYARMLTADGQILAWEQPGSENAYQKGDKVVYKGRIWVSVYDGPNVWAPDAYGWREVVQ